MRLSCEVYGKISQNNAEKSTKIRGVYNGIEDACWDSEITNSFHYLDR